MEELKIYSVSDRYIDYLRANDIRVYSNKDEHRVHTRKYVGVVLSMNGYNYFIPMSSPKKTDYQRAGEHMVIKKSIIPIIRIVVKNREGQKELKATLRVSHMIPVPESELEKYDLEKEIDTKYKDLVNDEIIFIRKNKEKIINNAKVIYKQKIKNDESAGYVKSALDFVNLENLCRDFCQSE